MTKLQELHIQKYAFVEDLRVQFNPRLTVLTSQDSFLTSSAMKALLEGAGTAYWRPREENAKVSLSPQKEYNGLWYEGGGSQFWSHLQMKCTSTIMASWKNEGHDQALDEAFATVNECLSFTGWSIKSAGTFLGLPKFSYTHPKWGEINSYRGPFGDLVDMVLDLSIRTVDMFLRAEEGLLAVIPDIENGLPPAFQKAILPALLKTFPEVQFIVSTHSPYVLQGVDKENVRMIERWADGEADEDEEVSEFRASEPYLQTKGSELDHLALYLYGISNRVECEETGWLDRCSYLIEVNQGEGQEAEELFAKVRAHFGDRSPEVVDLERLARWQKFKNRNKKDEGVHQ